mgnify:CR=1 FL=1
MIVIKTEELNKYINALLNKSEEAYLMSIEIINKPTINYRTEGFCFFICNAWELLLKAYLINKAKDINVINYKDGTNRTIGLDECVEKVFTSTTDKTKNNISFVRNIRNKATHLILPEYDFILSPAFQRCLTNYNKFFKKQFPEYNFAIFLAFPTFAVLSTEKSRKFFQGAKRCLLAPCPFRAIFS